MSLKLNNKEDFMIKRSQSGGFGRSKFGYTERKIIKGDDFRLGVGKSNNVCPECSSRQWKTKEKNKSFQCRICGYIKTGV